MNRSKKHHHKHTAKKQGTKVVGRVDVKVEVAGHVCEEHVTFTNNGLACGQCGATFTKVDGQLVRTEEHVTFTNNGLACGQCGATFTKVDGQLVRTNA